MYNALFFPSNLISLAAVPEEAKFRALLGKPEDVHMYVHLAMKKCERKVVQKR